MIVPFESLQSLIKAGEDGEQQRKHMNTKGKRTCSRVNKRQKSVSKVAHYHILEANPQEFRQLLTGLLPVLILFCDGGGKPGALLSYTGSRLRLTLSGKPR